MRATFGGSGGGLYCKGIELEIPEASLTTITKEVCLQICDCEEDIIPLKTGERSVSRLVALAPNKDPLTAPAQLYLSLQDVHNRDHELLLRWSPTEVGAVAHWRDVLPGTCKGQFAGPTARIQIIGQQVKVSTNRFGLFCIISRESDKGQNKEDGAPVSNGSFLPQGISEIIKLVNQKTRSEICD